MQELTWQRPLFFEPQYAERIWGGQKLRSILERNIPPVHIGESWEISAVPGSISQLIDPLNNTTTLEQLCRDFPIEIMGRKLSEFPLLIKVLDAREKLSVQVHPSEDNHLGPAKSEAWVILDAPENAFLLVGIAPELNRDEVISHIYAGNMDGLLQKIPVQTGDVIYIPAGTLHAITEGLFIYEVQQSSDCTFRVSDWGRRDQYGKSRDLHIEEALICANLTPTDLHKQTPPPAGREQNLLSTPHFILDRLCLSDNFEPINPTGVMQLLTNFGQDIELRCPLGQWSLPFGTTCLIPASLKNIEAALTPNRHSMPIQNEGLLRVTLPPA